VTRVLYPGSFDPFHNGHRELVEDRLGIGLGPCRFDSGSGRHGRTGHRKIVAQAVDLVEDRHRRVAGAQEVGVQRVRGAALVLDRPGRGHQRLAGHLAAEDPL
jgi:hypothetical protein